MSSASVVFGIYVFVRQCISILALCFVFPARCPVIWCFFDYRSRGRASRTYTLPQVTSACSAPWNPRPDALCPMFIYIGGSDLILRRISQSLKCWRLARSRYIWRHCIKAAHRVMLPVEASASAPHNRFSILSFCSVHYWFQSFIQALRDTA